MQGEHLLALVGGIGAHEAARYRGRRVEAAFLQVVDVRIVADRLGPELQARKHAAPREGVSEKILTDKTELAWAFLLVHVPFAGVPAAVPGLIEIVVDAPYALAQSQAVGRYPVFVGVQAGVDRGTGRRTDGSGGESAVKAYAAGSQFVDPGSAADRVETVGADCVEALLVAHEQQDVGFGFHGISLNICNIWSYRALKSA